MAVDCRLEGAGLTARWAKLIDGEAVGFVIEADSEGGSQASL